MLIEIDGRRYPIKRVEDLELRHIAQLQHELASSELQRVTSFRTVAQVQAALKARSGQPADGPEDLFLTCFIVWLSRVLAGEDVTLLEAISIPAASLKMVEEPDDHQAGEGAGKARKRPKSQGAGKSARRAHR